MDLPGGVEVAGVGAGEEEVGEEVGEVGRRRVLGVELAEELEGFGVATPPAGKGSYGGYQLSTAPTRRHCIIISFRDNNALQQQNHQLKLSLKH